jgi:hypothetical protein
MASPLGIGRHHQAGVQRRRLSGGDAHRSHATQIHLPPEHRLFRSDPRGSGWPQHCLPGRRRGRKHLRRARCDQLGESGRPAGQPGNFPTICPSRGIPGDTGSEDSFVHEILTFVRFPAAGYYRMGINNEDQFRLTVAETGHRRSNWSRRRSRSFLPCRLRRTSPNSSSAVHCPRTPLTAPVVYATPSGIRTTPACWRERHRSDGQDRLAGPRRVQLRFRRQGGTGSTGRSRGGHPDHSGDAGYPFRLGDINPNVHHPGAGHRRSVRRPRQLISL